MTRLGNNLREEIRERHKDPWRATQAQLPYQVWGTLVSAFWVQLQAPIYEVVQRSMRDRLYEFLAHPGQP